MSFRIRGRAWFTGLDLIPYKLMYLFVSTQGFAFPPQHPGLMTLCSLVAKIMDSEGEELPTNSKSRLCLANRRHFTRKFNKTQQEPKTNDTDLQKSPAHALLDSKKPVVTIPTDPYMKHVYSEVVDKEGKTWVNVPVPKRKSISPIKREEDENGCGLYKLGDGWTDLQTRRSKERRKNSEAWQRCKVSINGTHVSRWAQLDPHKPYDPPSFPDSSDSADCDASEDDLPSSIESPSSSADFQ